MPKNMIPRLPVNADGGMAETWLRTVATKIGLGFHPDTRGAAYMPALSSGDCKRLDEGIARCFDLLDDPYAVVVEMLEANASVCRHG